MSKEFWLHKADLQRVAVSKDGAGQTIKEWAVVQSDIPCYIRSLNGSEMVAAEKMGFMSTYRMYCSKDLQMQKTDRIVSNEKIYEITTINEQIGTHLQIDLKVVE